MGMRTGGEIDRETENYTGKMKISNFIKLELDTFHFVYTSEKLCKKITVLLVNYSKRKYQNKSIKLIFPDGPTNCLFRM